MTGSRPIRSGITLSANRHVPGHAGGDAGSDWFANQGP